MSYTAKSDGQTLSASEYTGNLAHGYNSQAIYDADTGGDDAYVITVTPAISGYLTGMQFSIKVTTPNTGAATLNVNSLGAKTIKKDVSSDLATGDILANQIITVIYDGTYFQLLNPAGTTGIKLLVSSNDTTVGYLNGKLVAGEGIDLTENNDGGNETLTVSGEDASTTNKGIASFNSSHFSVSSGVVSSLSGIPPSTKAYYGYDLNEEANYLIESTDLRSKYIEYKCLLYRTDNTSYYTPGGVNDDQIHGGQIISNGGIYNFVLGAVADATRLYTEGFGWTENGISAPGGTADFTFPCLPLFDRSQDTSSEFEGDCFLYCDSTTGYLYIHIGAINSNRDCNLNLVINVINDVTNLGDMTP
ncbi:MAG: hypothetical protein ACFFE4_00430 [Candidatus Thorarchaeota archaeon]